MKIKAVLFDMDGVLIDAKDWHYEALNQALLHFKAKPISREDHLTKFDGLSTDQKLKILSREEGIDESLHDQINDLKQKYTWKIGIHNIGFNQMHGMRMPKDLTIYLELLKSWKVYY